MSQDGQRIKGAGARTVQKQQGRKAAGSALPRPSRPPRGAARRPAPTPRPTVAAARRSDDPRAAVAATVQGLGYELVELERAGRGLLRVTIDRLPGQPYAEPGANVTVGDCEQVTRQLQFALEVDGVDYARLEVSSPGLDRPLRHAADYARFAGELVHITLREAFGGRKNFEGVLGAAEGGRWQLLLRDGKSEQVLGFSLDEVREARLVPVLDFKGRKSADAAAGASAAAAVEEKPAPKAQAAEVDGEVSR